MLRILTRIQHDFHRYALDDLHEVAGRIFRRQQAEARAGRAGDAVDPALVLAAAVRVDVDSRVLTGAHVPQLCFLEVRRHPHVIDVDNREQRLTGLHDLARIDAFSRHDAANALSPWRTAGSAPPARGSPAPAARAPRRPTRAPSLPAPAAAPSAPTAARRAPAARPRAPASACSRLPGRRPPLPRPASVTNRLRRAAHRLRRPPRRTAA